MERFDNVFIDIDGVLHVDVNYVQHVTVEQIQRHMDELGQRISTWRSQPRTMRRESRGDDISPADSNAIETAIMNHALGVFRNTLMDIDSAKPDKCVLDIGDMRYHVNSNVIEYILLHGKYPTVDISLYRNSSGDICRVVDLAPAPRVITPSNKCLCNIVKQLNDNTNRHALRYQTDGESISFMWQCIRYHLSNEVLRTILESDTALHFAYHPLDDGDFEVTIADTPEPRYSSTIMENDIPPEPVPTAPIKPALRREKEDFRAPAVKPT